MWGWRGRVLGTELRALTLSYITKSYNFFLFCLCFWFLSWAFTKSLNCPHWAWSHVFPVSRSRILWLYERKTFKLYLKSKMNLFIFFLKVTLLKLYKFPNISIKFLCTGAIYALEIHCPSGLAFIYFAIPNKTHIFVSSIKCSFNKLIDYIHTSVVYGEKFAHFYEKHDRYSQNLMFNDSSQVYQNSLDKQ